MSEQASDPPPGKMLARRVTLSGPAELLDDRQVTIAASLFGHFSKQKGHLGGHLLVDRGAGCFSATSFWETQADIDRTMTSVQKGAKRMCETIWGPGGAWKITVFEVIGLKPASRSVEVPEL